MNVPEEARIVKENTATAVADAHTEDRRGRILRDLRISVTDRCNFRCRYCMPSEVYGKDFRFIPHASLLSFEEIVRLASCFVALGVRKIRLTGGEPLLRRNVEQLVSQLAQLRTADGAPVELALTTNGSLLRKKAQALHAAGLQRVTVSLDALDDHIFQQVNSVGFNVAGVLDGIDAAMQAGLRPVKVNMVVKRGLNEQEILPMVRHFRGTGVVLRFIEYMDVGTTNGWRMDEVMPSAQVIDIIRQEFPLEAAQPTAPGETAQRWRHADGSGEIGVISSVTRAFCGDCNRLRLSTEGTLYTCLFASSGHDLRALLRKGAGDAELTNAIRAIWQSRDDRYSELRALGQASDARRGEHTLHRVEMGYIGG